MLKPEKLLNQGIERQSRMPIAQDYEKLAVRAEQRAVKSL